MIKNYIFSLTVLSSVALITTCNSWFLRIECGEYNVQQVDSPDGRFTAISYYRDCGATTAGRTSVIVRRIDQSEKEAKTAFSVKREHSIFMIWDSEDTLLVQCLDCDAPDNNDVRFKMH